jgi:hypothetical protein
MNGVALLLALSSLGVDYGVQQSEDGKLEYVIQIEPEYLRLLADGQQIHSDVPPDAGQVERVLVRVGMTAARHSQAHATEYRRLLVSSSRFASSDPARNSPDAAASIVWPAKAKPELNYHVSYGYQPDQTGTQSYYVQLAPNLLQTLQAGDEIRAAVDPAAGRVGRFVIHAGESDLPRIPAEPANAATPAPLVGTGSSRKASDRATTFGAGPSAATSTQPGAATRPPATAPLASASPTYGPPVHPDYGPAPSFGTPAYGGVRDTDTDLRTAVETAPPAYGPPAYAPPAHSPPAATYGDQRFTDQRFADRRFDHQPQPLAAPQYPAPQYPARTNAYAPPATNHAPQAVEDRVAINPRVTTSANSPLPAPQVNPASSNRPAADAAAEEKPWKSLMFVTFALFLSIGGNAYLGWTAAEYYSRYRSATDRLRSASRA